LFSSLQMRAISGRVYRGITVWLLGEGSASPCAHRQRGAGWNWSLYRVGGGCLKPVFWGK